MTVALTTPITGQAQTGFTTPAYVIAADTPPAQNAKQWAVTGLTGTQTGVITHSVAAPFTIAMFRPQVPQVLQPVDPVTGVLKRVGTNTYKLVGRKGVLPLAGQAYKTAVCTVVMEIPAGSDTADAPNLRALLSATFGAAVQASAGIGDTVVQGLL